MPTGTPDRSTGRPLTPRQSARRERILVAAQHLLAKHGYDGVSMKMIAEEAQVAERTLFNIHTSKDALIATSAHSRATGIFAEAWDRAPDPGMGFLEKLCATMAKYTLADPDMARSFAPVLIEHAELVGLHEIYRDFVGRSLASLAGDGLLPDKLVEVLPSLISMNMVGIVAQWACGVISSPHLESHMRLNIAQVLLPHASGELETWARDTARRAVRRIAE